jgi:3'(2'), 5'-bisphosphate nucleotidase
MEWDTAAGQLIVEEAGGRVVDAASGWPLQYNKADLRNPHFIATGREWHD